jgi:hypothetical protein
MSKFVDLVGRQFGNLTVLEKMQTNTRANRVRWNCSCACGDKTIVAGCHLVSGHTRSCGCVRKQVTAARFFKNCIGQRFGRLVVLAGAGRNKHGQVLWLCACDCGNEIILSRNVLARGHTKSCGCLHREVVRKLKLRHGMSKTREYASYHSAKQRCINPRHKNFADYGARGIEFRYAGFEPFFAELGPCPDGYTLDRSDCNGHYEPGNVRWASRGQQSNNRRPFSQWKRKKRRSKLEDIQAYATSLVRAAAPSDDAEAAS